MRQSRLADGHARWPVMAFSEAVAINPKRPLPKSGEVPFLDMAALPLNGAPVAVVDKRPVASGGARFQAGDTLFARITPCAQNGKLGFVSSVEEGGTAQGSTEFIVMAPREGLTLPEYVRWLSGWGLVRDHAIGLMEGTSGRQRIPPWAFDEIEVPVPPLGEQRRIAEVLRSTDDAITTADIVVAEATKTLCRVRDALIVDHRFDRMTLERATAEGLLTDGDWVESKDQDPDGEVRLVQLADIGDGAFIDKSNRYLTLEKARQLRCTFLQEGDLLLARMPEPLGRCCLFPALTRPSVTVVDVCVIRAGAATSNRYLAHALSTSEFRHQVLACASGTTRTRVSRGNLSRLEIPAPPIRDQQAIADVLDQLQQVVYEQRAASETLRAVKRQLMADLLSGHVRVPA